MHEVHGRFSFAICGRDALRIAGACQNRQLNHHCAPFERPVRLRRHARPRIAGSPPAGAPACTAVTQNHLRWDSRCSGRARREAARDIAVGAAIGAAPADHGPKPAVRLHSAPGTPDRAPRGKFGFTLEFSPSFYSAITMRLLSKPARVTLSQEGRRGTEY